MSEPFLAEIRLMSFTFPPKGWALCNGQLMQISTNQALFSLLGTNYGGDGRTTFGLPDLRGLVPMHSVGPGHTPGERGGQYAHTLSLQEMPAHVHAPPAVSTDPVAAGSADPTNRVLAPAAGLYHDPESLTPMRPTTITGVGGSQAHTNQQPYAVVSFCIATQGIFPSRN
jgi:microcystin-dependent protein